MRPKRNTFHITHSLCAALFVMAAFTSPVTSKGSILQIRAPSASSAANENCGFSGNADMYGVGIRIGVYCQAPGKHHRRDLLSSISERYPNHKWIF
jgi:hypothetical protein